jgi:two-component system response regulator HydG
MSDRSVLVVDDSSQMVDALERYLGDHGWHVETATGGAEAVKLFARRPVDVVLTDLRMEGTDGIDVLEEIHRADPAIPIVLMTAFGTVESAVDAIQRGAHHYITKPFKMAAVRSVLETALGQRRKAAGEGRPRPLGADGLASHGLVGTSAGMLELAGVIERVRRMTVPALIVGETGTGKELVARAIHEGSERGRAPFVAVSCAAAREDELDGLIAKADGGTLFLDEVADLPPALQGKLTRVIESSAKRRGEDEVQPVDLRCIASTNRDLAALVRAGAFRADLFYRLDVIPVRVPSLRERREDIPLLVEHFLGRLRDNGAQIMLQRLTPEALHVFQSYPWPGNVRELENILSRLVVGTKGTEVDGATARAALTPTVPGDPADAMAAAHFSLQDVQDRYVEAVLRQTAGNKVQAATILGVDVSTLYRRARRRRA